VEEVDGRERCGGGGGGGREYRTYNCPTGGVGAGMLKEGGGSLRVYIST
jgi:hypothetical protein